jgi:hypothetical protein
MNQSVATFVDAAARTAAIATPAEGQITYLTGSNDYWKWDGSAWVLLFEEQDSTPDTNYIINGAFDFWQRGTSFSDSADGFSADRWQFATPGGATGTITQQAFSADELVENSFGESQFYLQLDCTSPGSNYFELEHRVEDVRTLAGQTATLSYYGKLSSTSSISVLVYQRLTTGGTQILVSSGSRSLGTTWEKDKINLTFPDLSGQTIGAGSHLRIIFRVEEVNTFDIWGVQLEAGSVATPFKRNAPSLQGELAACQRYYQRIATAVTGARLSSAHYNDSTSVSWVVYSLPANMRATPTVTFSDLVLRYGGSNNSTISSITVISTIGNIVNLDVRTPTAVLTAGETSQFRADSATAYLDFSAEL